jgi:hypothetical protein
MLQATVVTTVTAEVIGGIAMRVLAKITVPVEAGNRAIKDGTLGTVMQRAAERWKPEAMYFTALDGHRTALMVFNLPDASDLPPFAEPFFMELNADVQVAPAMNADDLRTGLGQLG